MLSNQLQLTAAIGLTADFPDSVILHNDNEHLIYPLGNLIIIRNMKTSSQKFLQGHDNTVSTLALSISGTYLGSGQINFKGFGADAIVWNLNEFQVARRFKFHKSQIVAMSFSSDQRLLVTGGGQEDNHIVVWNLQQGKAIAAHQMSTDYINKIKFLNQDPSVFVSTHVTGQIKVWNLTEDKKLNKTYSRIGPVSGIIPSGIQTMCLLSNGMFIFGSFDGSLNLVSRKDLELKGATSIKSASAISGVCPSTSLKECWIISKNGQMYHQTDMQFKTSPTICSTSHNSAINQLAFPYNFPQVFASCSENDIRIWNSKSRNQILRIQVPQIECQAVTFMRDGKSLISGWGDGKIRAFLPQSGKLYYMINEAHKGSVSAIDGTGDSRKIVSGGSDGYIRVWRIGKQTQMLDFQQKQHNKGKVTAVRVNDKGNRCVSCAMDGSCVIWDLESYEKIAVMRQDNHFMDVQYSSDESQIVTTGTNGIITYWDWNRGKAVRRIDASHEQQSISGLDVNMQPIFIYTSSLHLSNGDLIATVGQQKVLKLWSYDDGQLIGQGSGHFTNIHSVRISPNNAFIVTGGEEGAIYVWRIPPHFQAEKPASQYGQTPKKFK